MSTAEYLALAPLLTISGGLTIMLLVIAFFRSHRVAHVSALVTLAATVLSILTCTPDSPQVVLDLLVVDGFAGYFMLLFAAMGIITCTLAYRYLEGRSGGLEEFYILVVTATIGAMTMAMAQHYATLLLGLEILSISLYTMIAYPQETHAPLEAATKYLILSGVASTTMLFGIALIFMASGDLYFSSLMADASGPYHTLGQLMLLTGLAFKLSLVPFHMWTPDVYQGAPAPVTGYIATVSKGALFALLLRFALVSDVLSVSAVFVALSTIAIASMIIGNVLALMQQNLKRLLAYSSIAHMGYMMIALLAISALTDTATAVESAMVYLLGYFLMTATAFGVISIQSNAKENGDAELISHYSGLFWRNPLLASVLTVTMLSLAGMPLTVGFIAKFYLFAAGVESNLWALLWALVIGSAISVYYYIKVIFTMTLNEQPDSYAHPETTWSTRSTLYALGLAVLVLGFYPTPVIELIGQLLSGFSD
ncbi:MAG: NADH-quinone oxidoreductase subunit N [Proteobacteria bacterium]|nr:NADH-quinone oxidoreductase subunit N [Pseudomonadota bacterium]